MNETFEISLRKVLTEATGVTALVDSKIYPCAAPETAVIPFIVYTVTDNTQVPVLSANSGTWEATVEIASISDSYSQAHTIARAVHSAMDAAGTDLGYDVTILSATLTKQTDDVEMPGGGEAPTYLVISEFKVWHD
jgi:hypothetical protein